VSKGWRIRVTAETFHEALAARTNIPLGRAEEFADVAAFLLSERAGHLSPRGSTSMAA
jgi:hypothetical protein